jgi:hypothetical protein
VTRDLPAIELQIDLTLEDLRDTVLSVQRVPMVLMSTWLGVFGVGTSALASETEGKAIGVAFVVLGVGLSVLADWIVRRVHRRLGPEGRRLLVRASEEALEIRQASAHQRLPWSDVTAIRWSRREVRFDVLGGRGPALPRRAITAEAERFLRERVETNRDPRGGCGCALAIVLSVVLVCFFGALWRLVAEGVLRAPPRDGAAAGAAR